LEEAREEVLGWITSAKSRREVESRGRQISLMWHEKIISDQQFKSQFLKMQHMDTIQQLENKNLTLITKMEGVSASLKKMSF
jgi:hypothetical protein